MIKKVIMTIKCARKVDDTSFVSKAVTLLFLKSFASLSTRLLKWENLQI